MIFVGALIGAGTFLIVRYRNFLYYNNNSSGTPEETKDQPAPSRVVAERRESQISFTDSPTIPLVDEGEMLEHDDGKSKVSDVTEEPERLGSNTEEKIEKEWEIVPLGNKSNPL